jgi:hypothetical protein
MLPTIQWPEAIPEVASGRLVVARYAAVDPDRMVPVQTSIGRPRWAGFEVVAWGTVAPWGMVGKFTDRAEFRRAYRARLWQRKPRILGELAGLLGDYPDHTLALCCFEDLRKPDAWCHRTYLAELLGEWLGVEIPDIEGWSPPDISGRRTAENSPPA